MQHNMDALLQSDEFRDKLHMIPPHLKGVFIKAVEELYDRESEKMLQLIWESRQEMRETYLTMEDEQKDLRSQSRMLEVRRNERLDRGRKSRAGRTDSRLSTVSDITVARGSRNRVNDFNTQSRMNGAQGGANRDLGLPESSGARASSAGVSHRAAPTPVFVKSIEELRDELFKHLSTAETKVESERERQRELLEWLKAEKRNKQQEKVEKANELLEEVTQMERVKAKDKERQEQRFKERLEEKKKLKEGKGLPPVESVPQETAIEIEPESEQATADGGEEETTSRDNKEKKKKKKHRHKDDEESRVGEEDSEERKERKERKKKHKHKDEDREDKVEVEDETGKEKKKEKKKHRHRHDEENPNDPDAEKERKKEKKKHRHRHDSIPDVLENGHAEGAEDADRKERKKEKKRSKKDKKHEEDDP